MGELLIRNYLILTGGLGNQLFQVAAASYFTGNGALVVDTSLSSKRNPPGQTELEKLELAENISFSQIAGGRFFPRKAFNMFLRISISQNIFLKSDRLKSLLLILGSRYFSHVYHEKIKIVLDGFQINKLPQAESYGLLFIGYFQAYKYCGELEMFRTHELIAKERSIEVEKIYAGHNDKTILVIHIRLGDYLNEENFGTPSSTYYSNAINKIAGTVALDECWIFSNDVEKARNYIPDIPQLSLKWFHSVGSSDIHVLMAMARGDHFVIGNSTFSWWASYLASNATKIIVAPYPWFKGSPEPRGLIPPTWLRIDAKF